MYAVQIFRKIVVCTYLFLILLFSFGCSKEPDKEIYPGTPDAFVTLFVNEINADTLRAYVQWMQNYTTRFFLAGNRKQIAADIKNKFIQLGYGNARIDSFFVSSSWNNNTYQTWQYNVIARLEGSFSSSDVYVIGAHYDCIVDEGDPFAFAPGANDNASGVAGVIEIARVMKKQGFVPKNSIEFVAFASEEYELNGSIDYVNKATASNANIVMMLNNDMISYDPNEWTVNVMDYSNSSDLRTLFITCGKTYSGLNFSHDNTYSEDGDSYSFYKKGYKALFIINDAEDSYYHTPDDLFGFYNFTYCKEVISVSCALLVQENKP